MDEQSPGWDAIDTRLTALYGAVEPLHYAAELPMMIGGNDPLQGISAYRSQFGGRPHWHFVTYGYSELYAKETDDPDCSGYGFEMTVRVIDPEALDHPPPWALSLLQNLARYVFKSGNVFEAGQYTTLNGPVALGRETALVAAAFVVDLELGSITTPNGALTFLQLVGITADEYDAIRDWDADHLVALLGQKDSALVTDLTRRSMLEDPQVAHQVQTGIATDGSSMSAVYSTRGGFDGKTWTVAANSVDDLKRLVRGRLEFSRQATVFWPGGGLVLAGGSETIAKVDGALLELALDGADRAAILEIPVKRGDYPLPSGKITVRVEAIPIWDGARKRVEREIG